MTAPAGAELENPERILDSFHEFEDSFRRDHRVLWWLTLVGPLLCVLAAVALAWWWWGWKAARNLVAAGTATTFLLGRFVILSGNEGDWNDQSTFLTGAQLFLLVTFLDWMTSVLVAFHIGFLFRLPVVGPRLGSLAADGRFILAQHPWMRRATFLGLVAFVAFPLAATGSVGGAIFGRLLGLSRLATFGGTAVGSVVGNGLMYAGVDLVHHFVDRNHPAVKYGGLVVILILIGLIEYRHRVLKRRFLNQAQLATAASSRDAPSGKAEAEGLRQHLTRH
jgi:uncharacterized membrane protein